MIKGLLFAITLILLGAFIGLAIWLGVRQYRSTEENDDVVSRLKKKYQDQYDAFAYRSHTQRTVDELKAKEAELNAALKAELAETTAKSYKVPFIGFIVAAIAMFGLVITVPGSFHQVNVGTYAVVKEVGKIVEVRTPGTYFDFYMTREYQSYDATVQQIKILTSAYSKDGQTMDLEVYLQYQIQLDKLVVRDTNGSIIQTDGIAGKYGNLESLQARIETQCIEKTKAVMSSAEAMTIIQNRSTYSEQVSQTVRDAIGPDYYVNVQDVVLTNIDFSDEFEKAVEDKVVAEQQKQAAITKAEAELEVAKIEAQKKIEEANGDAQAQLIAAEAAAKAATAKIIELARTLGYTIEETTDPATGVTTYKIIIPAGEEDRFNTMVLQYLEYLAYLEKWNGELPDVVTDGSGVIINVPGSSNSSGSGN